jgi:Fe-S-cluster-containing dehydrogenase component
MTKAISRREFLKKGATGVVVTGAALAGIDAQKATATESSVQYAMVIDLKKCVGCKSCTVACKVENHTPPGVAYNVVLEEEKGIYPNVTRRFIPRPCMQCESSSCTKVCPTGATYHRSDGIVAIDYDKCIGCRYCVTACPYGARSFDYGEHYHEEPTSYEKMASPEYAEYRKRRKRKSPIGNVRKCTFCLHRIKKGLNPACVDTCMGRAYTFGNMKDPNSEVNRLLATRSYSRLKEELGNKPRVYYLS